MFYLLPQVKITLDMYFFVLLKDIFVVLYIFDLFRYFHIFQYCKNAISRNP